MCLGLTYTVTNICSSLLNTAILTIFTIFTILAIYPLFIYISIYSPKNLPYQYRTLSISISNLNMAIFGSSVFRGCTQRYTVVKYSTKKWLSVHLQPLFLRSFFFFSFRYHHLHSKFLTNHRLVVIDSYNIYIHLYNFPFLLQLKFYNGSFKEYCFCFY